MFWSYFALLSVAVAANGTLVLHSRRMDRRSRERVAGLSGIRISLCCFGAVLLSALLSPLVARELASQRMGVCADNASELQNALARYVAHHGKFPDADHWQEALVSAVQNEDGLVCPEAPRAPFGYAFNAALSGMDPDAVEDTENTVVIFESDFGPAAGGRELLPARPRHLLGDYYVFADMSVGKRFRKKLATDEHGNVTWAKETINDSLRWTPRLNDREQAHE